MSYRVQGLSIAITKLASIITGDREVGQLIFINNDGLATNVKGSLTFALPLTEKFVPSEEQIACVQVDGIAMVQVETATSIVAGSFLKIGSTGTGVAIAAAGDYVIGTALEKPAANGVNIAVLLDRSQVAPA